MRSKVQTATSPEPVQTALLTADEGDAVTHVESKLPGEVIHAAGVHQAQRVPNGFRAQDALPSDRAETAIRQRCSHHTSRFTRDFDGAQLRGSKGAF